MQTPKPPDKLFKYRQFNVNTLRMLNESDVYYANPTNFNDPLDCKPEIIIDIDYPQLEKLCSIISHKSAKDDYADFIIKNARYNSTEDGGDYRTDKVTQEYYKNTLGTYILEELYNLMGKKGVFSLAEKWNCPLMWSHYADDHKGICLEYTISQSEQNHTLAEVNYDSERAIYCSDLYNWLQKTCTHSENKIFQTFFLSKAHQWEYEAEWRDINDRQGSAPSPFVLSAIYFGMRCDFSVVTTIVKLMKNTSNIIFYNVKPAIENFKLNKNKIDIEELDRCFPRNSPYLIFKDYITK